MDYIKAFFQFLQDLFAALASFITKGTGASALNGIVSGLDSIENAIEEKTEDGEE